MTVFFETPCKYAYELDHDDPTAPTYYYSESYGSRFVNRDPSHNIINDILWNSGSRWYYFYGRKWPTNRKVDSTIKVTPMQTRDAHGKNIVNIRISVRLLTLDCKFGDWVESECSKTCGGYTVHTKKIVKEAQEHGVCIGERHKQKVFHCNEARCPDNDCQWSDWSPTECSKTCGGGMRTLARTIISNATGYGLSFSGPDYQLVHCNEVLFPGYITLIVLLAIALVGAIILLPVALLRYRKSVMMKSTLRHPINLSQLNM